MRRRLLSLIDNLPGFTFLLCFCCLHQFAIAQKKVSKYEDSVFAKYADVTNTTYSNAKPYYVSAWRDAIPASIKIARKLDERIAIIEVSTQAAFDSLSKHLQMNVAKDTWKLSPSIETLITTNKRLQQKYIVTSTSIDSMLSVLNNHGKEVTILSVNRPSHSAVVKCRPSYIRDHLLGLKQIIFIDAATEAHTEAGIIGYNRSFHGINAVDYLIPGAKGKNIVAGVKEQKMDDADIDLWKRVLPSPIAATTTSNHATVIASIIGGAGNSFYDGRGIAWGCLFFPSSFANLFADDNAILNANKVSVQNHSYGTVIQQFYGAEAVSYDVLTWLNKSFVPVFSSGNQGESFAAQGRYANLQGYANLTGNFKMAKNIISVGAIDNNESIPPQSSAGPLYDGRLAPQLTALGPGGTSDATAIVTGTIAVMQQVYADGNNSVLPQASLTKAILFNTADDIYNSGIDYKTGYGLVNSYESIRAIQQKKYDAGTLLQGQWTKNISVPPNAAQLKVTLAWTDTAATVNNNKALVNDLDVEVKELTSGAVYQPWVLSTTANIDSLAKLPTRKRDSLNTAEQVSIRLPVAGTYQVKVTATNVSASSMPFHIAFNIDTLNTFTFTSPQHASDVNRAENANLTIRWKAFVADTNQTGNLYISYNLGTTWQLLQQVKIVTRRFQWPIKDTNSVAMLKMETPFGSFFSNRFIISKPTIPVVDFNCADSFRLSWNKHVYATGYRIFHLTDSPYLKPILTLTDTFVVLQKSIYPSRVYAVEPVLSNGLTAARSAAVDIQLQGVQCFYKTLNYNLLDYNKLNLLLELSVATYADSISFEKVSGTGQLLQTYGSIKTNSNLIYNQVVDEVPAGITYLRGRIRLINGAIVYTNIVPVLTSGPKNILFYPNPANRNQPLQYVLQQGIPASSPLQLFDIYGRLLKSFPSLPGKINVADLPRGVIIYKLLNSDNSTLETGKLIIQ